MSLETFTSEFYHTTISTQLQLFNFKVVTKLTRDEILD